jgi:hypothetical protein
MMVVDCPKPREPEFYHEHVKGWWRARGGARALLGYLLRLDLKGWRRRPARP